MAGEHYASRYEPLLSNHEKKKKKYKVLMKWGLRTLMWSVFIAWIGVIFLFSLESVRKLVENLLHAVEKKTIFGLTGALFLIFSGPIFLISLLAVVYVNIGGDEEIQLDGKPATKYPRIRLWTFPVLVDGPFGVVSAVEFIGICAFIIYVKWSIFVYVRRNISVISQLELPSFLKCSLMLEFSGLQLGSIGLYCLAFLFLPIARGSVLLRLIDIPFEQATRYHVWLGHLTMMLFTLHGLFYVISWTMQGRLLEELVEWKGIGVANLPGVISLSAGLLMWVTSLSPVRKKQFELFFYTHQLYVVFVVFLALHVGDFVFSMAAGGIFLFMLDRFLRFCQSRKTVDIISAKSLPCGTVELVLKKPGNLQYNALSFIFVQIRELSWLQWHPFSVSSSPLDGKNHLSILIKVLGEWTNNLHGQVLTASGTEAHEESPFLTHSKITASVEGPYGHEQPYHLTYENLILVAGGIGISPFFAILSDILHRTRQGVYCKPKNILVVWAIKKSDELPLLSTIDMESICPSFSDRLNLEICIYVTRESEPPLEEGKVYEAGHSAVCPLSSGGAMSALVGTGNSFWSGAYVVVSLLGFVILITLLDIFYINRFGIVTWWYKGLLFIACMVASVVMFGGLVICLWHLWEKRKLALEEFGESEKYVQAMQQSSPLKSIDTSTSISYGSRPDFAEIFGSISERWGHVDVGVIVCGPSTLQSSVAKECRTHNLKREAVHPVFHFNSHSFDL